MNRLMMTVCVAAGQVSNKNVYEISYPRKEVIEMEKLKTSPDSAIEFSRRYTRYSIWSKDQPAFGKLQFVE